MSDPILQALGRIEGKLDAEIAAAKEHREDDVRRFGDVYQMLGQHAEDINKAKGARGALMWMAGGVAALVGTAATLIGKKMGWL